MEHCSLAFESHQVAELEGPIIVVVSSRERERRDLCGVHDGGISGGISGGVGAVLRACVRACCVGDSVGGGIGVGPAVGQWSVCAGPITC